MIGAEPTAFEIWWTDFLNIAYPAIQMLFWLVMIIAAIVAVITFKRWVDAQTGGSGSAASGGQRDSDEEISVEEFVE